MLIFLNILRIQQFFFYWQQDAVFGLHEKIEEIKNG